MQQMRRLLWKEWRDLRPVVVGLALIVVVLSFVVQHFAQNYDEPEWTVEVLVPLLTGMHLLIVSSDIVSSDVRTRRIAGLALLPASSSQIWLAKALFVLASGFLFWTFTLLTQVVLVAFGGGPDAWVDVIVSARQGSPLLVYMGLATCSAMFFSTLSFRSFVAALLGAGLPAVIFSVAEWLDLDNVLDLPNTIGSPAAVITVTLLAASAFAFIRGRVHVSSRLRVSMLGLGALAVMGLFPAAAVARQVHLHHALAPGDDLARISGLTVSPDGRYLALEVRKGVGERERTRAGSERVWVLRVEDGRVFDWSGRGVRVAGWTEDGLLHTFRTKDLDSKGLGVWVEPETGDVVRVPTTKNYETDPSVNWVAGSPWASITSPRVFKRSEMQDWTVSMKTGARSKYSLRSRGAPVALDEPGQMVYCDEHGRLLRRDLSSGDDTVLVDGGVKHSLGWLDRSPSHGFHSVRMDEGLRVIDVRSEEVVWSSSDTDRQSHWIFNGMRKDLLFVSDRSNIEIVDVGRDVTIRLDVPDRPHGLVGMRVQPVADGGFVALLDQRRVLLFHGDGTFDRVLCPLPSR